MQPDAITRDVVREALEAIRASRRLRSSPLIELEVLGVQLRSQQMSDSRDSRIGLLPRWLEGLVLDQLAGLRGREVRELQETRDPQRLLEELIADFQAESIRREMWAVLHFRFFSGSSLSLLQLAEVLGVVDKTLRRRINRGYEALTEMIRDAEREAITSVRHGHNLPAELTSFVGREAELAEVRRLMLTSRLVTLTGIGGIGKSRIALRVAQSMAADFADGVWFVEIATLSDGKQVPGAVAASLGIQDKAARSALESVLDSLAGSHRLLVLDNCDHMISATSNLVGTLLQRCPNLQLLVTSREELHVSGESLYSVPPMQLLPKDQQSPVRSILLHDSVRLFGRRASRARPGFRLDEQTARRVADLCASLEGIPLAIELAAARTRLLTLEQLAIRLEDRFSLLRGQPRGARPGHEAMRAVMDMSFGLLDEREQTLLLRLSVFRGGWTVEAAEAVCSGRGINHRQVLELLTALEARSLLSLQTEGDTPRFGMLETVREYADEGLENTQGDGQVLRNHIEHFVAFAEHSEPHLDAGDQEEHLALLRREFENLRAALDYAVSLEDAEHALRLTGSLARYWQISGSWTEGITWTNRALALDCPEEQHGFRAKALYARGLLSWLCGDMQGAREVLDQSLAIRRETSDQHGVADTLNLLGIVAIYGGQTSRAERYLQECVVVCREIEYPHRLASALNNLGMMAQDQARIDDAEVFYRDSLRYRRLAMDRANLGFTLSNLGTILRRRGELEEAKLILEESLETHRSIGNDHGIASSLANSGIVAKDLGDDARALELLQQSLDLARSIDDRYIEAEALCGLAEVYAGQDRFPMAARHHASSLRLLQSIEDATSVGHQLLEVAKTALATGQTESAARLLGGSRAVLEDTGTSLVAVEREQSTIAERCRQETGEERFVTEYELGCMLSLDEAVSYALDTLSSIAQESTA